MEGRINLNKATWLENMNCYQDLIVNKYQSQSNSLTTQLKKKSLIVNND